MSPMPVEIDFGALCAALEKERRARATTYAKIAAESAVDKTNISRMRRSADHGIGLKAFARLVTWLGVPAETFFVSGGAR